MFELLEAIWNRDLKTKQSRESIRNDKKLMGNTEKMKLFVVAAVLVALTSATCPVDTVFNSVMNRCYKYVTSPLPFLEAQQFCSENNGLLINVLNATENFFVAEDASTTLKPQKQFWIGLNNYGSGWKWVTGKSVTFQSWAPNEPGNYTSPTCALSTVSTGLWYHNDCSQALPFVCAYDVNPPTTQPPTTTHGPKCPADQSYYANTDSCYFVGTGAPFWSAESMCIALNGHLTSIHSADENEFVRRLTSIGGTQKADEMTWIGLHSTGHDDWLWTDGSEFTYSKWEPGMPSNKHDQCVELLQDEYSKKKNVIGDWNNQPCDWVMRKYVCKTKPLW